MAWCDNYPHMVYVSVLLLDNKIENWKVGQHKWERPCDATAYWKVNRLKDYKVQHVGYWCKNSEEHEKVFNKLAPKWLKQFKYAKGYRLARAY